MIVALYSFAKKNVLTRARRIVFSAHFVAMITSWIFIFLYGDYLFYSTRKIGDVVGQIIQYSSIVIGFSITSVTLCFSFSNPKFANLLVNGKIKNTNAYSELFFVFIWTAASHWILVSLSILAIVITNDGSTFAEMMTSFEARMFFGLFLSLVLYCGLQFLVMIITIFQLSELYVRELERSIPAK